jgi:hypothetical protein
VRGESGAGTQARGGGAAAGGTRWRVLAGWRLWVQRSIFHRRGVLVLGGARLGLGLVMEVLRGSLSLLGMEIVDFLYLQSAYFPFPQVPGLVDAATDFVDDCLARLVGVSN